MVYDLALVSFRVRIQLYLGSHLVYDLDLVWFRFRVQLYLGLVLGLGFHFIKARVSFRVQWYLGLGFNLVFCYGYGFIWFMIYI